MGWPVDSIELLKVRLLVTFGERNRVIVSWVWVPISQHWRTHSCLVLFNSLGYQLLDILWSDSCFTTTSLISFVALPVFKASSEFGNFSLFLCKLPLQLLHLFLEAWSTGHQNWHVCSLVILNHLALWNGNGWLVFLEKSSDVIKDKTCNLLLFFKLVLPLTEGSDRRL